MIFLIGYENVVIFLTLEEFETLRGLFETLRGLFIILQFRGVALEPYWI